MELTQLRYFYFVYRGRSIRSASSELNVTQQAISRQIKNLEEELGVELFERKNSGVEPTEYGHMMADRVGKILTELDSFVYSVQKRGQIISGVVRLGVQCWQMSEGGHLPYEALKDFSGQNVIFPGEEVGSRSDILRSLHGMSQPRFIDVKDYIFDLLGQEVLGNQALMLTFPDAISCICAAAPATFSRRRQKRCGII